MTTLILPVAGKSSRFPDMRPKWLLTMPNGQLMFEYALSGLKMDNVNQIILIALREHIESFLDLKILENILEKYEKPYQVIALDAPTSSQSESVFCGLTKANVTGPIFIKDCDNFFEYEISDGNQVAYVDLHDCHEVNAANKSYIEKDKFGTIKNIVEKQIISEFFCCGGYQFQSAETFCNAFKDLSTSLPHNKEIYVSHIIYKLVMNGEMFKAAQVKNFEDMGTIFEYRRKNKKTAVIFCDVDGVLCQNGSKFSKNGWRTPLIDNNVDALRKIQNAQNVLIIVTTSRPESERDYLATLLESAGLEIHSYIMGLPHAQRILINDFASSNTYPSAHSINIIRNADNLDAYLTWLKM